MHGASCVVDELENNWGVNFTTWSPSKVAKKTQAAFDKMVRVDIAGYQLHGIFSAGTHSNMVALSDASDYNLER